ncbi:MAG: anaerobic glycerol-3-phosphate dehydrogenase subunit A [Bacteroidales bacterium]|nr:anaerobic glycerol-3-phosphate dehydrogenase subunit A [Bacteroidales bacterium]
MDAREFDVIIIGGGITGAGTQRDCAMRGLRTLLIERSDIATGATGRNHGMLHSGARYAVSDPESAAECIRENRILRHIAAHCIEETDGLFVTLPEDDLHYQQTFADACRRVGIRADIIDPAEARRLEPSVNPALTGAVRVPDGAVDPFRLCAANMLDAKIRGGQVRLHVEVTGLIRRADAIVGVSTRNRLTGEQTDYYAPVIVNAGGIWGHGIARMADIDIKMYPAKGALLIFAHRVNNMVINRCRKPSNADILAPGDTVCIIGTTSSRIPFEECNQVAVTPEEVDLLIAEGARLAPCLSSTRILRAFAGVRPLVSADDDPSGRSISRGIVCLDHEQRDGVKGLITITGGKLMTYRLMAEKATDLVCSKLGIDRPCTTAKVPLPGSEEPSYEQVARRIWESPSTAQKAAASRLGTDVARLRDDRAGKALICECEEVSKSEIDDAIDRLDVSTLTDLRRRTRVGMGTCQGGFCACRAAGMLARAHGDTDKARQDLRDFMSERWKGNFPIGWGDTLREAEYTQWVYKHVLGL